MNAKYILAGLMTAGIAAWMASGSVIVAGSAQEATPRPPAERADANAAAFRVRTRKISAEDRGRTLTMRGRTRADALVNVAAETTARIAERPVERGWEVAAGDVLCELDKGVRAAQLARANAEMEKAQLEFDAATKLRGRGFESQTRVATTKAALDAAQASVAEAKEELARTTILAPISGVVQEPLGEIGATLGVGGICATILDADPIIVTGQVSERDIAAIDFGASAPVDLVTGESVTGTINYVSATADADTRTFTVELSVPNPDHALRDGVTAEAHIPLATVRAHRLSPGVLTLDDRGRIGVRTVDEENRVAFMPVKIAMQDTAGFWVTGLPDTVTIITVGQEYVIEGQTVDPVAESDDV
ncbi:efflux RND transporter periplasmic adaptor subunit [Acuticoccus sp. I52.16.1]|uniref:efflux RND transporter periplasmic adaptor subunit n=1 Tax=Acuticoccus sp. I52.16.1 TaxID=2928472 RepID=UPI001FD2341A|nr:efflux RND transporter periplasmic adaptor subunit [Acuticoccus sp. I52.16.1]UOM34846.1 efflux RND transporter periplasmic adaptor subunit [Acuticoccus sp. I52.16.1]